MEEAPGIRLGEVWYDMKMPEKKRIVEGVVEIEKKLLSISFTRFVSCKEKRLLKKGTDLRLDMAISTSQAMRFPAVKRPRLWAIFLRI